MRFLVDACVASRRLLTVLASLGHDVLSAQASAPHASDEELLALALRESRTLVTDDKDFGELVFVQRLPHPCIVRFTEMPIAEKVAAMCDLIERYPEEIREGSVIVVTPSRVRIRRAERDED